MVFQKTQARLEKAAKRKNADPEAKALLTAAKQRRSERKREERKRDVLQKIKSDERGAVAAGKKPFYLKKSAIKQKLLDDRFDQLRKDGKLSKFLQRKTRKSAKLLDVRAGHGAKREN